MNTSESAVNLIRMPNTGQPVSDGRFPSRPKRLLDGSEVAKWLGVSKGGSETTPRDDGSRVCTRSNSGHKKARAYGNFARKMCSNFYWNDAADRTSARASFSVTPW